MKFLYPYFLFAFAVLLIPIILHLFHLRKFKTFYFSSVQFLKQVDTSSKSTRKIKQLLILLMRLFAFSCLVFAFAQPYFPSKKEESAKDTISTIYIDNSFSMQAMGVEGELLSQAKQLAQALIHKNRPTTKYIILSNDFSPEEQQIHSQADALDYIDQLDFSNESRKLSNVASLQKSILSDNDKKGQYIWISDGQKATWDIASLNLMEENIFPVILTPQNKENLSVDSIWFSSPIRKPNQKMEINVKISNNSKSIIKQSKFKVSIDNTDQNQAVVFDENNKGILTMNYLTPEPGKHKIKVSLEEENSISFDNELYAVFNVKPFQTIGLIEDENATNNVELVYQLDPFYQVITQNKKQLNFDKIKVQELIVVNQVKTIEFGLAQQLLNYSESGGNLALVPSEDCDIKSWNELLLKLKMPLLKSTATSTQNLRTIHQEAPFFNGVFEQKVSDIRIPVSRNTILISYSKARFLSLISYSDNSPFLCMSSQKDKNIFLFNSDLGPSNSNLLQSDLFSTLFLRIAESSSALNPLYLVLGESSSYRVNQKSRDEKPLEIALKDGSFIPQQRFNQNTVELLFNGLQNERLLEQGIYSIQQNNKELAELAFNYGRIESKTDYYTSTEIEQLFEKQGFKHVISKQIEQTEEINTIDFNNSNKLWRILLILGIIFFLMEMILLKVFKL